jgi:hypothetical protein
MFGCAARRGDIEQVIVRVIGQQPPLDMGDFRQRCQVVRRTLQAASLRSSWASEMAGFTPRAPRCMRLRRKRVRKGSVAERRLRSPHLAAVVVDADGNCDDTGAVPKRHDGRHPTTRSQVKVWLFRHSAGAVRFDFGAYGVLPCQAELSLIAKGRHGFDDRK